jgi:putative transposase
MFYYQPKAVSEEDGKLMRRIDEMHLKRPFYGSRRIRAWSAREKQ